MLNDDEKDTIIRVFNNIAIAKKFIREGNKEKVLQYIDYSLSWSHLLLNVNHPAFETDSDKLLNIKDCN